MWMLLKLMAGKLSWSWLRWVLLVTALLAGWRLITEHYDRRGYDRATKEWQAKDAARIEAEEALRRREEAQAKENAQEVQRYVQKNLDRVAADATRLHAGDGGVSNSARDLLATTTCPAADPRQPEATPAPARVLPDVLGELDRRAAVYAVRADELQAQVEGLRDFAERQRQVCQRSGVTTSTAASAPAP